MPSTTRLPEDVLADVQGFITSGFGHLSHATYLFVEFHDTDAARRWLGMIVPAITTASPWPTLPTGEKLKPAVAVNIAVTADGLAALGVSSRILCTFPVEFQEGIAREYRSRILGDTEESDPARWEIGGTARRPVHAIVIIHAVSAAGLEAACDEQRALVGATGEGVTELVRSRQSGYRPAGDYEPFGFHDGVAQPSIAGVSGEGVPTGEFILGYLNHYGIVPPTPVVPAEFDAEGLLPLLDNPHHASARLRDLGVNGSHVVYRKLQQAVAGFWQFLKREAVRAGGEEDPGRMVWLAARMVGRWPSGDPGARRRRPSARYSFLLRQRQHPQPVRVRAANVVQQPTLRRPQRQQGSHYRRQPSGRCVFWPPLASGTEALRARHTLPGRCSRTAWTRKSSRRRRSRNSIRFRSLAVLVAPPTSSKDTWTSCPRALRFC